MKTQRDNLKQEGRTGGAAIQARFETGKSDTNAPYFCVQRRQQNTRQSPFSGSWFVIPSRESPKMEVLQQWEIPESNSETLVGGGGKRLFSKKKIKKKEWLQLFLETLRLQFSFFLTSFFNCFISSSMNKVSPLRSFYSFWEWRLCVYVCACVVPTGN